MSSLRTLLFTCSLSQVGCAPIIYELVDHEHGSTGEPSTTDREPTSSGGEPPEPTCMDKQWNGEESDIDCGGPCPPCGPGQRCEGPLDCFDQVCDAGKCVPGDCQATGECPPPGPCEHWECDPGTGCVPVLADDGTPCESEDLCTFAGLCKQGECLGPTVDCSIFDGPCHASQCNPDSGKCEIEATHEGEPCDDGLTCTVGDTCLQGVCIAEMPPFAPLLLTDFSVADGWSVEPPWEIGPAIPSKCAEKLADDPFEDHSPGFDGMLAGALIGACLPLGPFPTGCLTSPPIDVKEFPAELWLRYWSVLNTAGLPMDSRIEVFDGKIQGWTSLMKFNEFTAEQGWTEHSYELTPYVGPGLRIRFCHSAMGPGPAVGGWSLDDLSVGPLVCDGNNF